MADQVPVRTSVAWGAYDRGQRGSGDTEHRFGCSSVLGFEGQVLTLSAGADHALALTTNGRVIGWGAKIGGLAPWAGLETVTAGIVGVAAGRTHDLAVIAGGSVVGCGDNSAGQVTAGAGTFVRVATPVVGLEQLAVSAVAAGAKHSLALTRKGQVWAWGSNDRGQVGEHADPGKPGVPVPAPGLDKGVVAIAAGAEHSLALMKDGSVWTWGTAWGEADGNHIKTNMAPVPVAGLENAVAVAAGDQFSLALSADGAVFAWGDNSHRQLGPDGAHPDGQGTAVRVGGLPRIVEVRAGSSHCLARAFDGSVWAWGMGVAAQLGVEIGGDLGTPTRVAGLRTAVLAVAAGQSFSLALLPGGSIVSWGQSPDRPELPRNAQPVRAVVQGLPGPGLGAVAIAAGAAHSLAVTPDGAVLAWGTNNLGQVDGRDPVLPAPVRKVLPDGQRAVGVAAGVNFSLALGDAGAVTTWGSGAAGQLGDPSRQGDFQEPKVVPATWHGVAVAAGAAHALVLDRAGAVWGWGLGASGQLGPGREPTVPAPVQIANLPGEAVALAAGDRHSLAVLLDGSVYAWGANSSGQLGSGTTDRPEPGQVAGLPTRALAVAGGASHSLALLADGSVMAWGDNAAGQLGAPPAAGPQPPRIVLGLERGAVAVAAGGTFSAALLEDGTVRAWGGNAHGERGVGDATSEPGTAIVGTRPLPGAAVALCAGAQHVLALMADGTVAAWGDNALGQVGDGTKESRPAPVPIRGIAGGLVAVAAGGRREEPAEPGPAPEDRAEHTLAVTAVGGVLAWGANSSGQIGDGTFVDRAAPVHVGRLDSDVIAVAAGGAHSVALTGTGQVFVWGNNGFGQVVPDLPDGLSANRPQLMGGGLEGIVEIAAGRRHTLARTADGTVWGWGDASSGQLGPSLPEPVLVRMTGLPAPAASVACGDLHNLAVLTDGTVWAWGASGSGQLGPGAKADAPSATPVPVPGLTEVKQVAAGAGHSLALAGGKVFAWGANDRGQLGAERKDTATPAPVGELTDVVAIAAGHDFSLARLTDGTVWAWGENLRLQLGLAGEEQPDSSRVPVRVACAGHATAIAVGGDHAVALGAWPSP